MIRILSGDMLSLPTRTPDGIMILKGGPLNHLQHTAKMHSSDHRQPYIDRLGSNMATLRQIERRMDALFQRLLGARGEQALSDAEDRLDELLLTYPELRIPRVAAHPQETGELLARLDLDRGPLPGFEQAMQDLVRLCLTPACMDRLRSKLYAVAARASRQHPELLPSAALAALSIRPPCPTQTLFTEMVLCASAIEWGLTATPHKATSLSLDVSTWLAAEPSERLLADVGKERAHYYASIPGVLPLLDPNRILFDVRRLASTESPHAQAGTRTLNDLAHPGYTSRLRTEIERVQGTLRETYPAPTIADVELLTHRALEALDDLPVQVNPLLQAIWIQSWVRHLHRSGQAEETRSITHHQWDAYQVRREP
jgi:hypothetical protein